MKLYLSFGFVGDDDKSTRLFYLEQPIDQAAVGKLVEFVKNYLFGMV